MMRCFAIVLLASGCQSLFGLDDSKPRGDAGDGRCYGTGIEVCFDAPLTDMVPLTAAIDTGTQAGVGASAACVPYTGHDEGLYCVVAGSTVSIASGAKISVTGSRPLVVIADQTLQIDGVLDAAAHVSPVRQPGPAADVAICPACLSLPARTGGGTGGSFGEDGAVGGAGDNDAGGGLCAPPDLSEFRAGCAGQNAGTSDGMTGLGGGGGGALYLLAGTSITITGTGTVDVSGAGGVGGRCTTCDGAGVAFGGGGGGSGGMLVLESPDVEVIGHVYADGGGGGEGASHSTNGQPGADPDGSGPALGGNNADISYHGGAGGNGGHIGSGPVIGENGTSSAPGGGGGGGGGIGVIRVIGTLTGTTSPAPR